MNKCLLYRLQFSFTFFSKEEVPDAVQITKVPIIGKSSNFREEKCSTDPKDIHLCSKKCENDPEDIELSVQKEEWLEFLRQTIHNVMLGDVDVLLEKHSLKLIMNAFNTCYKCPVVVTTVARLLSLPFIAETVSENNMKEIKQVSILVELVKYDFQFFGTWQVVN